VETDVFRGNLLIAGVAVEKVGSSEKSGKSGDGK
jgi:hypothetical protein